MIPKKIRPLILQWLIMVCLVGGGLNLDGRVLDEFSGENSRAWSEYFFGPGKFTMSSGTLKSELNWDFSQLLFSARIYEAETFDLTSEGLTFQASVTDWSNPASFAVLGFFPFSEPVWEMQGYFIAFSQNEVRVGKGFNQYLRTLRPENPFPEESLILRMRLAKEDQSVRIEAAIIDESSGVTHFEAKFFDSPSEDVFDHGRDLPAQAFLGPGRIGIMHLREPDAVWDRQSQFTFDDLEVSVPAQEGNLAPFVIAMEPSHGQSFVEPGSDPNHFVVDYFIRDNEPGALSGFATGAKAVSLSREPDGKGVRSGSILPFVPNQTYDILLNGEDAELAARSISLQFDTFMPENKIIQAEDYNFDGGSFFDDPDPIPEGLGPEFNAYMNQAGVNGIDFMKRDKQSGVSLYRPADPVPTLRSPDYVSPRHKEFGAPGAGIYDYIVSDIQAGEFLTYTREFTPGFYEIYLRLSLIGAESFRTILERKLSTPDGTPAEYQAIGEFYGNKTGFRFSNLPLSRNSGKRLLLWLDGEETLRLNHSSEMPDDSYVFLNYFVCIPSSFTPPGVESSETITGPFTKLQNPAFTADYSVFVPIEGATRFYRLAGEQAYHILSIAKEGEELEIRFATGK